MPRFLPEPNYRDGAVVKSAVLLVNLGTPDAPTPRAVRRYLAQFLSDPRVIEVPRAVWLPILHGIVLNTRPRHSARKYVQIWSADGSPLKVHTDRQARLLANRLHAEIPSPLVVEYAMRYGEPSIRGTLARLKSDGCDRILIVPMYPQYAASTTGSVFDEVAGYLRQARNAPEIRLVKHFHDHPGYIGALAASVREHWERRGRPDRFVVSFHGLPQYSIERGDPYHRECHKTARLLAENLQLADNQWQVAFQSRFGRLQWLKPYTASILAEFAGKGVRRVDLVCPGFVCDCLETLEEIGIEGRQVFLEAGGKEFHLLPCLNEREDWIRALAAIAQENLAGWVSEPRDLRLGNKAAARQGQVHPSARGADT
jgi:ferrochelatase